MKKPASGFYYHHKHIHDGHINNCAIELLGVTLNQKTKELEAICRPLDEDDFVRLEGADFLSIPLRTFMGESREGGKNIPTYAKITDQDVIDRLVWFRNKFYPQAVSV